MKITRVDTMLASVPFQPSSANSGGRMGLASMETLFVRVQTDEGLDGWGEAFGFKLCATTKTAIDTLIAPLCIGRDPHDIDDLMRDVGYRMHNYGRNGPALFGLAGIDIALWDIAGKAKGLPLYRLLGGETRDSLPAYASLWRYGDAATCAANVARAVERGYREIKLHEIDIAVVAAARAAAGPDIPITLDVNCTWTADEAIEITRRLAPLKIKWIEEPTWPPEDYDALAKVSRGSSVPVAAGENITSVSDFALVCERGAVAFAQPSVAKIGVGAMMRVLDLTRRHGIEMAPHSPYFGPGLIATMHICAAAGGVAVERYYCDLERGPLGEAIEATDGRMTLPQEPGLGVTIDEAALERMRIA